MEIKPDVIRGVAKALGQQCDVLPGVWLADPTPVQSAEVDEILGEGSQSFRSALWSIRSGFASAQARAAWAANEYQGVENMAVEAGDFVSA